MSRALYLLLLFCSSLGAAPSFAADKKKDKLPVPPPQPVAQEVSVKRGESIDIRLSIYGRKNETLKYLIRGAPEAGRLSEPRPISQEASMVTYKSTSNVAIKHVRILYAVQNSAGVSAPVEIGVSIVDDAEHLIAPDLIDFSTLLAGGAALKEMEISNIGGSVCEGEVVATPPWRIEGPTAYKLAAGARQKFLVFFEPKTAGFMRGELRYSSEPTRVTSLKGDCNAAIGATPAEVRLLTTGATTARTGQLELANNTADEQVLTLSASPRLHVPPSLTLPAGGRQTVAVSLDEGDPSAYDDTLLVGGAGLQVHVPLHAPALGAVLRVSESALQFPVTKPGKPVTLALKVENRGGVDGFWKATVQAPFRAEPASLRLRPREQGEIAVTLASAELGTYQGTLRLEGEQQAREVGLEGEVAPPGAPVAVKPARPETSEADAQAEAAQQAKAAQSRISTLLYLRDNVKIRNITSNGAMLEWPTSLTNTLVCRVELRSIRLDDQGKLRTDWLPAPVASLKQTEDRYFAELRGLRPGSVNIVRVVPVPENGEAGAPLFMTQIETLPPKAPPFRITLFNVAVFLLVVVGGGAFAWKRVHRVEEE